MAELLYVQHGGSSMQLTYSEIMDMEINEIFWWAKKLHELREKEVERLKTK